VTVAPSAARFGGPRTWLDERRATWLAFAALLVIAFVYLSFKGRETSFFYDEWGWIQQRRSGLHWILASYNQHLLAVPIALYQLLFGTVGLAHYWVYRLFETVAHLSCATLLFVYARRRIGSAAVLLTLPILFLGSGWDYVLWPVNFGFVASIALGIGALLSLDRRDRRGDLLAGALLVVGLACSEFTIVFLVGMAVELLWRDRSLRRAWIWGIPLLLFAAWWLGYHEPSMARKNMTAAPAYAADLAANAMGGLFGLDINWGRALLVAAVLILARRLTLPGALTPRAAALLVAAGVFWLVVALGRAQLGDPTASRYVYTGAILIVLIAAEALRGVHLSYQALALGGLVAIFALAGNIAALTAAGNFLRVAARVVTAELGALQVARGIAPAGLAVDPKYAPVVFAGSYFAAVDSIRSSPADSPQRLLRQREDARTAADGLLVRAGELQVTGSTGSPALAARPPTVELASVGAVTSRGSCVEFRSAGSGSTLDLTLPAGGLEVGASGPPTQVRARRFDAHFEGNPITALPGGGTVIIHARKDRSALPWHLRISPLQPVRACALG
jgi:hypothetical protein